MPQPKRAANIQSLSEPDLLSHHLGSFEQCDTAPINTGGYSGAKFSRISLKRKNGNVDQFILKDVRLKDDWFSQRTNDHIGREANILLAPDFASIHKVFHTPYRLVSAENDRIGLLMDDLTEGLFPDEKKPLSLTDQDLMLDKLAEMHACFWQSASLEKYHWLHSTADFVYIMGPLDHQLSQGASARNIQEAIRNGWEATQPLLPDSLLKVMQLPPTQIVRHWQDLPKTLIHGDTKVANFAKSPDGRLSLFDWAFVGHAPCTFDIGWFLAVNASRLAESKEAVLSKYRKLLEKHLGQTLKEELWLKLEEAGIVCGAFMLLWSKGNAMANQREDAAVEWQWWLTRLQKWAETFDP